MKSRCFDCEDHSVGCHDGCVKYLSDWLANEEEKKSLNKAKAKGKLIRDLVNESKARQNKSRTLGKLAKHKKG